MIVPLWVYQQTSTIRRVGVNGRGEKFTKTTTTQKCRIEQKVSQIRLPDGSVGVSKGKGIYPPSADVIVGDMVTCNGIEYEVTDVVPVPTLMGISHKEVVLI